MMPICCNNRVYDFSSLPCPRAFIPSLITALTSDVLLNGLHPGALFMAMPLLGKQIHPPLLLATGTHSPGSCQPDGTARLWEALPGHLQIRAYPRDSGGLLTTDPLAHRLKMVND